MRVTDDVSFGVVVSLGELDGCYCLREEDEASYEEVEQRDSVPVKAIPP